MCKNNAANLLEPSRGGLATSAFIIEGSEVLRFAELAASRHGRALFALVTFAGERGFQFRFLSRRNKESVLLRVFDDFFGHHFALEAA